MCSAIIYCIYIPFVFTAGKRSLRRLCFYTCLSVHTGPWAGAPLWSSACCEIRATSKQYASQWNVFLLYKITNSISCLKVSLNNHCGILYLAKNNVRMTWLDTLKFFSKLKQYYTSVRFETFIPLSDSTVIVLIWRFFGSMQIKYM